MKSTIYHCRSFLMLCFSLLILRGALCGDYEGIPAGDGLLFDESEITFRTRSFVPKMDNRTIHEPVMVGSINIATDTHLYSLFFLHKIDQLPVKVQEKFVARYLLTREKKYLPGNNLTFCTTYYYDYLIGMGHGDIIEGMNNAYGKTMVEKALNYADNTNNIQIIYSAYEAQQLANQGRDVGVIGEYYYDNAEMYFTRHYAIVQPSIMTFNNRKEYLDYPVYGCISNYNVNNRDGTGALLAQAGSACGLVDFGWSYNRKMNGIIQKTANGNIRGGIVFVLFPAPEQIPEEESATVIGEPLIIEPRDEWP